MAVCDFSSLLALRTCVMFVLGPKWTFQPYRQFYEKFVCFASLLAQLA